MKTKVLINVIVLIALTIGTAVAQKNKVVLFDMSHGQQDTLGLNLIKSYSEFVQKTPDASLTINREEITTAVLKKVDVLIVITTLFPQRQKPISPMERQAMVEFVKNGGGLLLVCEADYRTKLEEYGANDIVKPFGMEYGVDCDVPANVGAIAFKGEICQAPRELPYSGGRTLYGGTPLSVVNYEGGYQHIASTKLKNGGKIVAAGDAMAYFLLGKPAGEGERFFMDRSLGLDNKWWGKDARIFMQEVITWLLQ